MCGIAGIVGPGASGAPLDAMLAAQAHRGPDGEGRWSSPGQACLLGHRRLAIIDIDGGAQPLTSGDSGLWITFNGCIYNYIELRRELETLGYTFGTRTDTEVILNAYAAWGKACLDRLNGMFAFAIWDERNGKLFCARDRVGIKPFYYTAVNGRFAFASEIKALLPLVLERRANAAALADYIIMQSPLGADTLFDGVRRLEPGRWIEVDSRGSVIDEGQFWRLSFTPTSELELESHVDALDDLLADAVRLQMRADVTVGAHLSGGMDSSFIVAAASPLAGADGLHAFTGAFDIEGYDETHYASLMAEVAGAKLHTVRPGAQEFADLLERIAWHMDEPAAGPGVFPQFMVSGLAADHVKVVLGGQGGDEIFGGYARYLVCYLEECLKGAIEETADRAEYAATLAGIIPNLPLLKQYTPLLRHFWSEGLFGSHGERYFHMLNRSADMRDLYTLDCREDVQARFNTVFDDTDALSFLDQIINLDTRVHLQGLLHVEDRTSMAWGLESRVPLLDHRILEFMARVPVVQKFRNGETKALFKRAVASRVPGEILKRKDKMGFPVPLQQWFASDLRDWVHDILLSEKARSRGIHDPVAVERALASEAPFGRGLWGVLNLELWHRQFVDAS